MDDDRICWPTEEACQCVLTFQPRELGITFGHVAERAGFVLLRIDEEEQPIGRA